MQFEHDTREIKSYHAHVYYDNPQTKAEVEWVRAHVLEHFPHLHVGKIHESATGVHTKPMFQIKFHQADFAAIVSWLTLNHQKLSVLIHPDAKSHEVDYQEHSLWIGAALPIRFEMMVR